MIFFSSIRAEKGSLSEASEDVAVHHHFSFQLAIIVGRMIHHTTVSLDTSFSFPPTH